MEQVPSLLHDISKSLKTIAEKEQAKESAKCVYVFTAEQAWDYTCEDIIVRVFDSAEKARKCLHDFIYAPASDGSVVDSDKMSVAQYVEREGWEVEYDEPDRYKAYIPGSYADSHIECTITKCTVELVSSEK